MLQAIESLCTDEYLTEKHLAGFDHYKVSVCVKCLRIYGFNMQILCFQCERCCHRHLLDATTSYGKQRFVAKNID